MKFKYPDGATPIDLNEADGLMLPHISTKAELDRWEQDNILEAEQWLAKKKDTTIIGISFIGELHKRMFDKVRQNSSLTSHPSPSMMPQQK